MRELSIVESILVEEKTSCLGLEIDNVESKSTRLFGLENRPSILALGFPCPVGKGVIN